MNFKIITNISKKFKEIRVIIEAPEMTKNVQNIISTLSDANIPKQIVADKNNEIYFIDVNRIICFFSSDKINYVRTEDGDYRIKYKLYEIEELFSRANFVRISKSCIININQVNCFDTSIIGTIIVKFKNNTKENVSKRNIPSIMKLLNERRKVI